MTDELQKELQEIVRDAHHDLSAPMRHLSGFADAILEDYAESLPDEGKKYLKIMIRGTKEMRDRLDRLTQELIDFSEKIKD